MTINKSKGYTCPKCQEPLTGRRRSECAGIEGGLHPAQRAAYAESFSLVAAPPVWVN